MTVREFRLIMIITFVVTNAINFLVLPKETSASTETQQFNGVLDARSTQYFVIERSSEEPISIRATKLSK